MTLLNLSTRAAKGAVPVSCCSRSPNMLACTIASWPACNDKCRQVFGMACCNAWALAQLLQTEPAASGAGGSLEGADGRPGDGLGAYDSL